MTVITKKPEQPDRPPTPEDIEQLGHELDAIRQDIIDSRGETDAAYIRKVSTSSASSSSAAAPCCWLAVPAGLGASARPA